MTGGSAFAEITLDVPSTEFGREAAAAMTDALDPARTERGRLPSSAAMRRSSTPRRPRAMKRSGCLPRSSSSSSPSAPWSPRWCRSLLALVAVAVGLCGIALLAGALDVSTAAPTFGALIGLGVGIDYSLFIVSRYRDNRAAGQVNRQALSAAMGSSGTSVFFAGGTVIVSMAALALTGVGFLTTIGLATSLIVLFAVADGADAAARVLSLLGDRIDAGRIVGRRRSPKAAEETSWWRLAHRIAARPWPYLVAAVLILLTLAAPALALKTGFPNAGDNPTNTTERRAYDLLADGFGPGFNAPLIVVADLDGTGLAADDITGLAQRLADDPGVAEVGEPQVSANGDTVVLPTLPTTEPSDPVTAQTIDRIRAITPAGVLRDRPDGDNSRPGQAAQRQTAAVHRRDPGRLVPAADDRVQVRRRPAEGGRDEPALDRALRTASWLPSSSGAGWAVLFGLEQTYLIASPFPLLFFAVLFGLSMDYEVFLVSRIREAYLATGDTAESVARGLAATGRVITSAALIMVVVFLSFVTDPSPFVQMIGLGLAAAIAIDATVVRMILVPATMTLMGKANWWLPGWLDRLLPHLSIESDTPVHEPSPVVPEQLRGAGAERRIPVRPSVRPLPERPTEIRRGSSLPARVTPTVAASPGRREAPRLSRAEPWEVPAGTRCPDSSASPRAVTSGRVRSARTCTIYLRDPEREERGRVSNLRRTRRTAAPAETSPSTSPPAVASQRCRAGR